MQDSGKHPDYSKRKTQITVIVKNTVIPKITAKKATFKAKRKTEKYTITLKASENADKKSQCILKNKQKNFLGTNQQL